MDDITSPGCGTAPGSSQGFGRIGHSRALSTATLSDRNPADAPRPAWVLKLRRALRAMARTLQASRTARQNRRCARHTYLALHDLDDRTLLDLGLARSDVLSFATGSLCGAEEIMARRTQARIGTACLRGFDAMRDESGRSLEDGSAQTADTIAREARGQPGCTGQRDRGCAMKTLRSAAIGSGGLRSRCGGLPLCASATSATCR